MISNLKEKYEMMPLPLKASLWFVFCSVMQRGISVIATPIFTRIMSTTDYGQYGVFNSWLDIISIFVTLRLYYGVFVQGLVKYEEDQKQFASSMQGLGFTLCLSWTIIYAVSHDFWNHLFKLTTVQMLAMMVMIWSAGAFRFWAAEQRNQYKYRLLVAITLIVSVMKVVFGVTFVVLAEDKVTARILALALVELIGYSGAFFIQMIRGKKFFSAKYWKIALLFNLPLIPHYLSQTVLNSADRIMIRSMIGASEAGIYTLAYSISRIMSIFNTALHQTISPWTYQKIKANSIQDIKYVTYPALIGIAAINLMLIAFAPEIVYIFAPKSYHNAIWVIPPVAMSVFFTFSYNMFATFEFYFERTKFIMTASIIGAVLNIVLNYIFLRLFGYYAAGYTTLVCYMVYAIGHYIFMGRVCQQCLDGIRPYETSRLLIITGLFLGIGFILMLSYLNTVVRYCLIIFFCMVCLYKRNVVKAYINQFFEIRKEKRSKGASKQS